MAQSYLNGIIADRGSPFLNTSGLKSWYQADTIQGADGATITLADDLGYAKNTMIGDASAPTIKRNIINGRSVMRFNGSQFLAKAGPNLPAAGNAFTYFLVFSIPGTIHKSIFCFGSLGGTNCRIGPFVTSSNTVILEGSGHDSNGNATVPFNTFMIISGSYPGGNASLAAYRQFHNGLQETMTSASGAPAYTLVEFKIGGMASNTSFNFTGDIPELAIFDRELGDNERIEIEKELGRLYNVTLTYP